MIKVEQPGSGYSLRELGEKVNGAGGEGGSVTILCGDDPAPVVAAVGRLDPPIRLVPVALSPPGLRIS